VSGRVSGKTPASCPAGGTDRFAPYHKCGSKRQANSASRAARLLPATLVTDTHFRLAFGGWAFCPLCVWAGDSKGFSNYGLGLFHSKGPVQQGPNQSQFSIHRDLRTHGCPPGWDGRCGMRVCGWQSVAAYCYFRPGRWQISNSSMMAARRAGGSCKYAPSAAVTWGISSFEL
jgi:hypothetical protein